MLYNVVNGVNISRSDIEIEAKAPGALEGDWKERGWRRSARRRVSSTLKKSLSYALSHAFIPRPSKPVKEQKKREKKPFADNTHRKGLFCVLNHFMVP